MSSWSDGNQINTDGDVVGRLGLKPASYVVWLNGTNYEAVDMYGKVAYGGSGDAGGVDGGDADAVIQAACDALTSGGCIYIKRASYSNVNVAITTSNVHILAEPGTTFTNSGSHVYFFYIRGDDITVEGITFNPTVESTMFYIGTWDTETTIKNVTIQNCQFTGPIQHAVTRSNKVTVRGFTAQHNLWHDVTNTNTAGQGGGLNLGYGATYAWRDISILNNHAHTCESYDNLFSVRNASNVTIANNRFHNIKRGYDYKYCIMGYGLHNAAITGNVMQWDSDPSYLTGGIHLSYVSTAYSEDVAVTGNSVRGASSLTHLRVGIYGHGVDGTTPNKRVTVSGNTVLGMEYGIQLTYTDDCTATGNVIKDSRDQGLGFATVNHGVASGNVIINSNRDENAAGYYSNGISISASDYILVDGNTVYDATPKQHYAIYEANDCTATTNIIRNNRVYGAVTDPIYALSNANVYGNAGYLIEHHTANDTLATYESGSTHTNLGATGNIKLTLPQTTTKGCTFNFAVMTAAQQLQVDAGAAGAIYINGAKSADDAYIWADDEGESVKLVADGNGDWVALYTQGTWTVV